MADEPAGPRTKPTDALARAYVFCLSGTAAALTFVATARGIGLSPDSIAYYASAQRIASHPSRMFSLGTHPSVGSLEKWPPFYPAVMGASRSVNADLLDNARPLHALLAAVVVLLIAGVLRRGGASWRATAACTTVIVVTSGFITQVFAQFVSESLFLALAWGAVTAFDRMLTATSRRVALGFALLTWGLVAAASLTRILGLSMVPAFVIIALLVRDRKRVPLWAILPPAVLSALPALYSLTGDEQTNRATTFAFQSTFVKRARTGIVTVDSWVAPSRLLRSTPLQVLVTGAVLLISLVGAVWVLRWARRVLPERDELSARDRLTAILLLVGFGYIGMLLWNAAFVDSVTPMSARHLLPFFVDVAAVIAIRNSHHLDGLPAEKAPKIVLAVGLVAFVAVLAQTTSDIWTSARDGSGYSSKAYTRALDDTVTSMPQDVVIYSDRPDMVYGRTGRPVGGLPQDPVDSQAFRTAAKHIGDEVAQGRAAVVYFDIEPTRSYLPPADRFAAAAHLKVIQRDDAQLLVAQT